MSRNLSTGRLGWRFWSRGICILIHDHPFHRKTQSDSKPPGLKHKTKLLANPLEEMSRWVFYQPSKLGWKSQQTNHQAYAALDVASEPFTWLDSELRLAE